MRRGCNGGMRKVKDDLVEIDIFDIIVYNLQSRYMKKIILLILVFTLLSVFKGYSQARIGYSFSDLKKEYGSAEHKLKIEYTEDGILFITANVTKPARKEIHYFKSDKTCFLSIIIPENRDILNKMVDYNNKNLVIISASEWNYYSPSGILSCKLNFDNDFPVFIWSIIE